MLAVVAPTVLSRASVTQFSEPPSFRKERERMDTLRCGGGFKLLFRVPRLRKTAKAGGIPPMEPWVRFSISRLDHPPEYKLLTNGHVGGKRTLVTVLLSVHE